MMMMIIIIIIGYSNSSINNTWIETSAPIFYWASITSDSSGQYLAAAQGGGTNDGTPMIGYIYISSNGQY